MTWLIELGTEQIATGPLHGELLEVITKAVEEYVPGYLTKSRIQWRVDDEPDDATMRPVPPTCPNCHMVPAANGACDCENNYPKDS